MDSEPLGTSKEWVSLWEGAYGKRIQRPDNPRMKILVEGLKPDREPSHLNQYMGSGIGISEIAQERTKVVSARKGKSGAESDLQPYACGWDRFPSRQINTRSYSDREVRRHPDSGPQARGHTARQIASILERTGVDSAQREAVRQRGIHGLLRTIQATKVLSPRGYLEMMLTKMERAHDAEHPTVPFARPTLEEMGRLLEEVGYVTPRDMRVVASAGGACARGRLDGYYSEGRPREFGKGKSWSV